MYTAAITSVLTTQLGRGNSDSYLYMQKVGKSVVVKNYLPKFRELTVKHNLSGWTNTPN